MNPTIREERLKIGTTHGGQIFLRHLHQPNTHAAVLMLHGLGSSGDAFIKEGHGLANYLSEMGIDCFVPDLIGHGNSWPHISRHLEHSVNDIIQSDLLKIVEEVSRHLKGKPLFLVGQGFGSVMLLSAFARHPRVQELTQGFIHFNARRSTIISGVTHSPLSKMFWKVFMPFISKLRGDVPIHWTKEGLQPEAIGWYQTFLEWSESEWIDSVDQFNYSSALRNMSLPPSLYFATRNQKYYNHTADARTFMRE